MTLKASSNRFNPAYNLFRFSVRKNMGLTFLFSAFMLLVCPGYTLMRIYDNLEVSEKTIYNFDSMLPKLITGISVATALCAMLFCFINFSYLYSRKATDVYHSLPTTRKGLLMARFFASIVPVLIPVVLVYCAMLCIICLHTITGSAVTVLLGMVYNILSIVFCCAFMLVFLICAGSILEFLTSFIAVNVGLILIIVIALEIAENFLIGFSGYAYSNLAIRTSPFMFVFIHLISNVKAGFTLGNGLIIYTVKLIIGTLLLMLVSCLLYNKRKSEKNGVSYAYRLMYTISSLIVGIVGSFALGILFSKGNYNHIFWCFAAVGGVLTAITYSVITEKGFKNIRKSVVTGLCSLAVLACLTVIFITGGLGFSTRIPNKNSITVASVEFNGNQIEFNNPQKVITLHEKIAENINSQDIDNNRNDCVRIDYKLKGGFEQHRVFYIDFTEYVQQLLEIYKSQENINSIKQNISKVSNSNLSISVYGEYAENENTDDDLLYDEELISEAYLTKKEFTALINAYTKDVLNATEKSIELTDVTEYIISGVNKNHSYYECFLYVEDSYKNTRQVLDSLDLKARSQKENG